MILDPTDPRHGKASTYENHGCRCGPCTKAASARAVAYQRDHPGMRRLLSFDELRERHLALFDMHTATAPSLPLSEATE